MIMREHNITIEGERVGGVKLPEGSTQADRDRIRRSFAAFVRTPYHYIRVQKKRIYPIWSEKQYQRSDKS